MSGVGWWWEVGGGRCLEQVKDEEDEINICPYKSEPAMINDSNKVFVINSVSDFYGKYK